MCSRSQCDRIIMNDLTETGHISGMLDRDQRTAKFSANSYRQQNHQSSFRSSGCGCGDNASPIGVKKIPQSTSHRTPVSHHSTKQLRGRTSPSSYRVKNHNRLFWVTISKLHRTLLLGIFLTLVTIPTSLAAPSTRRPERMSSIEKWMNPCGRRIDRSGDETSNEVRSSTGQMLSQVIEQSKRAHGKANEFKERFAKKVFKMDWKQLQDLYKSHKSYDWLPQIPKNLGEPVTQDHLNSLKLDSTLHNTYENFQRIAVGFDRIVQEEKMLKVDFEEAETYVLSVLCEIENTIIDRKLSKRPDIQRDIMPENLKNGDNTAMNLRNYMILRDYINNLEYVIACYEHLKANT